MLKPRMVMEALCSERRTMDKCFNTMADLFFSNKIQSWYFSKVTHKVVAVADVDPREVMSRACKSCRLIRVDWIEDPRFKKIKDPSEKYWVDPVEDLRTKWCENTRNSKWLDPAEDPRKKWMRRMVMEMLCSDKDEWNKALRAKSRFNDKIYRTVLDRELKKMYLIGDMDPYEVMSCLHDYCRLLTVEWFQEPRRSWVFIDGPEKLSVPNIGDDEMDLASYSGYEMDLAPYSGYEMEDKADPTRGSCE